MKRLYFLLTIILATSIANAQETKTMTWNGHERQYLEYVPTSYQSGSPAPLMLCLHGLGDNMNNAFHSINVTEMAEERGWIVVFPQALDYTLDLPLMGAYDFGPAWEAGINGTVTLPLLGTMSFTINEGVDDSGFLNEVMNVVASEYTIDSDSIFFTGFSLGAFMSHRMAIEHGDRINGIAAVSGLVGNMMKEITPLAHVNVLQVFGTNDQTIGYENASIEYQGVGSVVVGLNAEQSTEYWRLFNQCDNQEVLELYPDTRPDGLTFEMHSYLNGNDNSRVSFLKVNNGEHAWYDDENNDIDYLTEICRFFTNTLDVTEVEENRQNLPVYPNPACDFVQLQLEETALVSVYDRQGARVLHCLSDGRIDVSGLANGLYLVQVDGTPYKAKFAICR